MNQGLKYWKREGNQIQLWKEDARLILQKQKEKYYKE